MTQTESGFQALDSISTPRHGSSTPGLLAHHHSILITYQQPQVHRTSWVLYAKMKVYQMPHHFLWKRKNITQVNYKVYEFRISFASYLINISLWIFNIDTGSLRPASQGTALNQFFIIFCQEKSRTSSTGQLPITRTQSLTQTKINFP